MALVRACQCCQARPLVYKRVKTDTVVVLLGLCPDCDVRTCHWGNPECPLYINDIYTKHCPAGHFLP